MTNSPEQGAQTQIFLSASSALTLKDSGKPLNTCTIVLFPDFILHSSGKYFDNSKVSSVAADAEDMNAARRLWTESESLVNKAFTI